MITLRPVGGLCNRLFAIDSMIRVCESIQKDLKIIWLVNEDLGTAFSELYQPLKSNKINIELVELDSRPFIFSDRLSNNPRQIIFNTLLKVIQRFKFDFVKHAMETSKLKDAGFDFHLLSKFRSVYISSWSRLDNLPFESTRFNLKAKIKAKIPVFKKDTIGIHVRRSDHLIAIQKSPLENFLKRMNEEIKNNPNIDFFVASDSNKVKAELKNRYEDRIIVSDETDAERHTQSGMIKAIIDLYGLANTSKLIGSSISTFTLMASEINGIELIEISQ